MTQTGKSFRFVRACARSGCQSLLDFWIFGLLDLLGGLIDVNVLQIDAWTHRVWLNEILRHWELRDLIVASDGHDEVAHLSELAP